MNKNRKVILYIAMSLDGYIAKPNNDLSFLNLVQKEGEDYGYAAFINTVDTVILGRKTYDWIMTQVPIFPHANNETYIITRTPKTSIGNINYYTGNLNELVINLKSKIGKNIFVDGGAEIVNEFLKENLIDEFIISIIPILLGNGTQLFKNKYADLNLKLVSTKQFEKGLVQLHYQKTN